MGGVSASSVLVAQLLWASLCLSFWPWSFHLLVMASTLAPIVLSAVTGQRSRHSAPPFLWPDSLSSFNEHRGPSFPICSECSLLPPPSLERAAACLPLLFGGPGPGGWAPPVLRKAPCAQWALCRGSSRASIT